ncbi:MAG: hypothetical protein IKN42_06765 [Elusimicrobia bacterium]|nr:hypothetical protein [Elusimicrobiota bacterium]
MKKFFSLLAVLALVGMVSSAVWAAPTTEATHTALASFSGGTISFSADLYNWNSTYTGTTATNITFNTDGFILGSSTPVFKCASVYALIQSNITASTGKVWVYQDNKNNSDSKYVATTGRTDGSNTLVSGLVKANSGGSKAEHFAPLKAYYKKLSDAKNVITTLPTQFPPDGVGEYGVYNFVDKGDSNYVAKDPYTLIATGDGNYVGTNEWGRNYVKEDVVMFFGATFTNVLGGDSYGTNSITFISEIE